MSNPEATGPEPNNQSPPVTIEQDGDTFFVREADRSGVEDPFVRVFTGENRQGTTYIRTSYAQRYDDYAALGNGSISEVGNGLSEIEIHTSRKLDPEELEHAVGVLAGLTLKLAKKTGE